MAVKFFDEAWYLARNPDVAELVDAGLITAEQHFEQYGQQEGRSPSPLFDTTFYVRHNPDVAAAVEAGEITPYVHFTLFGHAEGRQASPWFSPANYLAQNPDVAAAVNAGEISVHEHYQAYGIDEGRAPLASFDPEYYLALHPDVAAAVQDGGLTAARHFMSYGINEDRSLSPAVLVAGYLAAQPDVAAAVAAGETTGLAHLLTYGIQEGRDIGNGVSAAQFVNDPVYQNAIDAGDTDAALARMAEVSPFLAEFEPPEGFELPADWPIPQDFVPVEGTLLTVPEGWVPAEPVRLPDYFEQPFTAVVAPGGMVTFPDATGEITVVNEGGQASFAQGGFLASVSVLLNGTATVQVAAEQVLVGDYGDIAALNIVGEGGVRAEGTAEADTIDATGWNAVNLTVDAKEGNDTIAIRDTQTAIGGEGADTFVIAATAGVSSVITVEDYTYAQGDVIDLTGVENFDLSALEVRGAEYDGTTWLWGPEYTGDSVGLWFAQDNANVQLTGARTDTVQFLLPDTGIPGLEGYTTLKVNIADGGIVRAGDEAGELLRGGDGNQFLISGAQADMLSGGAGNDVFVIEGVAKSSLASMDRIVDFEVGADTLVSHTAIVPGSLIDGGAVADLEAATIAEALNAEVFTAYHGAYFTVGEGDAVRSFVVLNDGTAGFDAATDTVVEVTGVTGNLADLTVIGVPDLGAMQVAV